MEIKRGGKTCLCSWLRKSPGNLHQEGLKSLWNSSVAQEIRSSILDGTFRYCNSITCPYLRSGMLPLQKDVTVEPYQEIIRQGRTKIDRMNLWLSFDFQCNLRCISCRNSSVFLSKKEQTDNQSLIESVHRDLTSVSTLGISGKGEPFASPLIRNFLFSLDGAAHPDLKLFILTNGQLLTRECWAQMEKAHPAIGSVQISIDAATKETYETTRLGGSFEILMENLHNLSKLRTQNTIEKLIISFVVNARNFIEMKQFVTMGFDFKCDYVYFAFMRNWGVFTGDEYKKMAVHRPKHEKYPELQKVLEDPLFNDPRIFIRTPTGFNNIDFLREPIFI
jgi:wyosine [tRNA(Phe)-imidazoG37] synthetase (radical SAM superfamily)